MEQCEPHGHAGRRRCPFKELRSGPDGPRGPESCRGTKGPGNVCVYAQAMVAAAGRCAQPVHFIKVFLQATVPSRALKGASTLRCPVSLFLLAPAWYYNSL